MKKVLLMALLACCVSANAFQYKDKEKKDSVDSPWNMHFSVGVNVPTNTGDYSFAPFKSWNLNWTVVAYEYTPKGASQTYSIGAGLSWRNYTLRDKDRQMFVVGPNKVIIPGQFALGQEDRWSNIHTLSITLPLLFKQQVCKDFSISVGAELNFNVYGRVHNSYEQDDVEVDVKYKGIEYRPFTIDPMAIFDYKDIGFYVKYSPMSVLKKDYGPDFKCISMGLYF